MADRLKDRIALITGASRGIGAAVAKAYAREGAHLILVARNQGGLEEVDDEVTAQGGSATLVPMDLAAENGIEDLGRQIYERWGRLDVLVGNAAILGELTPVGHIEPKKWGEALAVNLTANWRLENCLGMRGRYFMGVTRSWVTRLPTDRRGCASGL